MKIVLIGSFGKIWDEEGKARCFEKLGCDVERMNERTLSTQDVSDISRMKPDLVIWAKLKCNPPVAQYLVDVCRARGIKTVSWHPDLFIGLPREIRITVDPMFKAHWVLSPDGGHESVFKKYGVNHKVVRQGVYDEDCYIEKTAKKYDVVFIGCQNHSWLYRTDLMNFLAKTYSNFRWIGKEDSDEIRGADLNRLISQTKIIIGDSVKSDNYWSNRIYETIGRGGFIIHPMIKGLEEEYTPYKHFVPYYFGDFDGLKTKIDYFLDHPDEREAISKAGFKQTKKLTLLNKCKEVLCITALTQTT